MHAIEYGIRQAMKRVKSKKETIGPREQELFRIKGGEKRGGSKGAVMQAPKRLDPHNIRLAPIKPTR